MRIGLGYRSRIRAHLVAMHKTADLIRQETAAVRQLFLPLVTR